MAQVSMARLKVKMRKRVPVCCFALNVMASDTQALGVKWPIRAHPDNVHPDRTARRSTERMPRRDPQVEPCSVPWNPLAQWNLSGNSTRLRVHANRREERRPPIKAVNEWRLLPVGFCMTQLARKKRIYFNPKSNFWIPFQQLLWRLNR